ncbi:hypothetical protein IIB79_12875, partial [candidate division KSB1 bacterium]|nr:hypothetical protein [candidate division KSB1 bacterium]
MNNRIIKTVFIVAFVILLSFSAVFAQKQLLTNEDVKKWERIGQTVLSDDGNWLAYTISLVDGDGWLMLKNVDSKSGQKFPVSSRPVFTKDNDWFAFTIGLPKKERDKLQKAKKPVRNKVGLVRLGSTEIDTVTGVSSFGFTNDGDFLVMKKYKAEGKESRGSGLVYRNLETGIDQLIGDVAEHIFSEEGSYIALIKDAEEQFGNGIYLYNLGDGIVKGIETDRANYLSIAWDEDDTAVTFLKGTKNEDYEGDSHTVFAVSDIFSADPDIREFDPNDYSVFPEGYRIVGIARRPRWSKDGSAIFFGIKEWEMTEEAKKKKEKEAEKEIEEADPSKGGTSEEKEDVDKEKEEEKDD